MTNFEKIIIIANQLANEGKKPSVALIKSKVAGPLPLPQIISALRSWQHEPENCVLFETSTPEDKSKNTPLIENDELSAELINEAITVAIDNALGPIKAELAEVKAQLQQLTQK
ncbi:hypothetical protein [Pseudocolwellia agarivorans]|uniref:hypothetical protein n=1 Tax=Pseudocolwellia agarivorans TaxID=1911682 RepID=UPI000985AD9B|nr:hypothetical protein [Pseudocolwellia agarivorans]